jgi:hypothetical protein
MTRVDGDPAGRWLNLKALLSAIFALVDVYYWLYYYVALGVMMCWMCMKQDSVYKPSSVFSWL